MKQLLLSVFFVLLSAAGFAQATAYDVPDINQCGYEVFDLTQQNAAALGNQSLAEYTVTFFTSQVNAEANTAAITNPTAYVSLGSSQTIYLRVTKTLTGDYDVTSFQINVLSGSTVGNFNDVTVCGSYNLSPNTPGNYYTGPNGTGMQIPAGTLITTTQLIYVYFENGICTSEDSFVVTVIDTPEAPEVADVTACGGYTLPVPPVGYSYYTQIGGSGTQLAAGMLITASQTIYVYASNGVCEAESSFTVTITGGANNLVPPNPIVVCDPQMTGYGIFDLLAAQAQFEAVNPSITVTGFYFTQADAQAGINAIPNAGVFMNTVAGQQTIFLAAGTDGCVAILPLELIVIPCQGTTTLTGTVTLDANGDGCDAADGPAAGIAVGYNFGNYIFYGYTDVNGHYTFTNVPEGTVTLWLQGINQQEFTASPAAVTLNLPTDSTVNDFCISVPAPYTDVAVYAAAYSQAVPGFTAYYAVTAVNYGTEAATGTLNFSFDSALLTVVDAGGGTVTGNIISWPYTNLAPYQSVLKYVYLQVATPPTVQSGTPLVFSASATVGNTDVNPDNNAYLFTQYAVNSFDPNDIAVREGESITEAQADGFLHYTVRFQNTGTANAQNVRVNVPLDANLDWNTFEPIAASHTYYTNRTEGNVDFMFNNIQLPFEEADEPGSHGFVLFRIKPVANVEVGDSMSETAYIYFDFNEAIVTNTVTTTVEVLNTDDFTKADALLYPNPANGLVNIKLNGSLSANANVVLTDVVGKQVLRSALSSESTPLNISGLTSGVYFVTVQNNGAQSTQKLIIK